MNATYGGGGGGAGSGSGSSGGAGGGGGTTANGNTPSAGTANTGGGGGGGNSTTAGGAGGSGLAVVRYAYTQSAGTVTLSGNIDLQNASTLDAYGSGGLLIVSGIFQTTTGTGGLTIASSNNPGGVVRFDTVAKTYAGDTMILGGATLRMNVTNAKPNGAGKGNVVLNGGTTAGTLDLNNFDTAINGLNGTTGAVLGQVVNNGSAALKTLTVGNGNASGSFAGIIRDNTSGTGTVALTKTGTGTQTLSGANIFTGATTINGGILELQGGAALADANAVTITSPGVLEVDDAETIGSLAGTGNATLNATLTTGGNNTSTSYSGIASGSGGLTKEGSGIFTLSGGATNTYTGVTTVNAGILDLARTGAGNSSIAGDGVSATDDLVISGGTVRISASQQIANNARVNMTSGTFTFNGTGITETVGSFTNSGGIFTTNGANTLIGAGNTISWAGGTNTITDAGTVADEHWVITGGTNTVNGGATGGTLQVSAPTGSPTGLHFGGTASPTITLDSHGAVAGRILLQNDVIVDATLTTGTAQILSGGALANPGFVDLSAATRTFDVGEFNGAGVTELDIEARIQNGGVTKTNSGTLEFSGTVSNTYAGATSVNDGTLLLNKSASTNAIAGTTINVGDGTGAAGSAVLQLGTNNEQIINTANLTIFGIDGNFNVNGRTETINGLSGTNLGTAPASPAISLGGGTLNVGGPFNVESALTAGQFEVAGAGTLNLNGTSTFDLYSAANYDHVDRTGLAAINVNGVVDVNLAAGYDPVHGTTFMLFQNTPSLGGGPFAMGDFDFTGAARPGLVWDISGFAVNGTLVATGVAGNIWDTNNTTAGATDTDPTASGNWSQAFWTNSVGGTDTTGLFNNGAMPVFSAGSDATGSFTVNVDGGTHNVAGILVQEGNVTLGNGGGILNLTSAGIDVQAGGQLTIDARLTGAVGLTKLTSGTTLTLTNTLNSYTGNTLVNEGTLRLGNNEVLPNGTNLTIGSGTTTGTLEMNNFSETVTSLTVFNNSTVQNALGSSTTLTLAGTGNAIVLNNGSDLLDNTNFSIALTGGSGGNIVVQGTGALSQFVSNLNLNGVTRTFDVADINGSAAVDLEMDGVISGSGAAGIIKAGAGTMRIDTAATYAGTTTVSAGVLQLGANNVLPGTTVNVNTGGGTGTTGLDRNSFSDTIGALSLTGGAVFGSGTLTLGGTVTSTGTSQMSGGVTNLGSVSRIFDVTNTLTINDQITAGDLVKNQTGTLILTSTANNYSTTTVNAGILQFGASNVLPNAQTVTINTGGGTGTTGLNRNSFSDTIGALNLNGGAVFGSGTLTLGGTVTSTGVSQLTGGTTNLGGNRTFDVAGTLTAFDVIAGVGNNLTKTNSGDMVLRNANTYSGTTNVEGGTLRLGSGGSIGSTTQVNIGVTGNGGSDTLHLNNLVHTLATNLSGGAVRVGVTEAGLVDSDAGAYNIAGNLEVGIGAAGTVTVDNSTLDVDGRLLIGGGATTGGTPTVSGTVTINAGGTLQVNGATTIIDATAPGVATLNVNGGTFTENGGQVIVGDDATGTFTIQNGGSATITATGTQLNVGNLAGSSGQVNISQTPSSLTVNDNAFVGRAGAGAVSHTGGTVSVTDTLTLGLLGTGSGTYTMNQNTGTSELNVGGNLVMGDAGAGNFNQSAGETNVAGSASVAANGPASTLALSGGTFNVANNTAVGGSAAGVGTVTHTGGTYNNVGNMNVGVSGTGGVYTLNGAGAVLNFGDTAAMTQATPVVGNPASTLTVGATGTFNFLDGTLINVTDIDITSAPGLVFTQEGGRFVLGVDGGLDPNNASTQRAMTTISGGDFNQTGGRLVVDIFGNLTRTTGTNEFEGYTGPQYDPIDMLITDSDLLFIADGKAYLDGTLEIDLNGVDPNPFAWYDVVVADEVVVGSNFDLEGILWWRVIQDPSDPSRNILQVAVPEPASIAGWCLLALALGSVAVLRRRKRASR